MLAPLIHCGWHFFNLHNLCLESLYLFVTILFRQITKWLHFIFLCLLYYLSQFMLNSNMASSSSGDFLDVKWWVDDPDSFLLSPHGVTLCVGKEPPLIIAGWVTFLSFALDLLMTEWILQRSLRLEIANFTPTLGSRFLPHCMIDNSYTILFPYNAR